MKIIAQNQNWNDVEKALAEGKFVNHAHWRTNKPHAQPDYVGPVALGRHGEAFVIVTDAGVVIHDWNPSRPEMVSEDWQIVEIAGEKIVASPQAPLIVAPTYPIINHDPSDPRSPIQVSGPQARPPKQSAR